MYSQLLLMSRKGLLNLKNLLKVEKMRLAIKGLCIDWVRETLLLGYFRTPKESSFCHNTLILGAV